jgi:transcriptional regulator with XRE-family HTH domain
MPKKEWPPKEEFADRFARLRRHKRLENADIAEATGVVPKTVSMWAGGQAPKGPALLALARLLDVSPDYLLTGQEAPQGPAKALDMVRDAVKSPRRKTPAKRRAQN